MRGLKGVFAVALLAAPDAMAQTLEQVTPPPVMHPAPPPQAPVARPVALPESYADSLRIAVALLPEGKETPRMATRVAETLPDQVEAHLRAEATKRKLGRDELAKLDAYVDMLPDIVAEGVKRSLPSARNRMAMAFAGAYSVEEAASIADFYETDSGVAFLGMTSEALDEANAANVPDGSVEEAQVLFGNMAGMRAKDLNALMAFMKTPGGKAMKREKHTFDGIVAEKLGDAINPWLTSRVVADACAKISRKFC